MSIPVSLEKKFLYDLNIVTFIKKFNTFSTLNMALSVMTNYNHISMINILIDKGADNLYNNMYHACRNGYLGVVKLLSSKGLVISPDCFTVACEYGHLEIVKYIYTQEEDTRSLCSRNVESSFYVFDDALKMACKNGNIKLVQFIIGIGANNYGVGLYGAIIGGHKNIMELMFNYYDTYLLPSARTKYIHDWGLEGACQIGDKSLIDEMIKNDGETLYGFIGACKGNKIDIAQQMLKNCVKDNYRTRYVFNMICCVANDTFITLFITHFSKMGVFFSYSKGLDEACGGKNMSAVKLLIKSGAVISQVHFESACKGGNVEIVQYIADEALKQNIRISFQDGVKFACEEQNIEVIKFLINRGVTYFNSNILNMCYGHNIDFVRFIIQHMMHNNTLDIETLNLALLNIADIYITNLLLNSGLSLLISDMTKNIQRDMSTVKVFILQLPKQSQLVLFNSACERKNINIVEFLLKHNPDFKNQNTCLVRNRNFK